MKKGDDLAKKCILAVLGIFIGATTMWQVLSETSADKIAEHRTLIFFLWLGFCVFGAGVILKLHNAVPKLLQHLPLTDATRALFLKYHPFTYSIFLSVGLASTGIKLNIAFGLLVFLLFIIAQLGLLWFCADQPQKERWSHSPETVPLLFFISGFAALIYQVVWQRVLFAVFGTNIESVTVIVSVFMFGLGIGALIGGQAQKYFPKTLLEWFVGIELAIGVFGLISISLIQKIGALAPHDSLPALIASTYALLALPTMLMGSTLPILVGYLQRRHLNLGTTVSQLYACNTFGSALAALLTVMLFFTMLGQQSTLLVAVVCNAITAAAVWYFCRQQNKINALPASQEEKRGGVSYPIALLLSVMIGYVSLSLEILWFRILGFMTANLPQVFGLMLATFLAGLAYGAIKAKRWNESNQDARLFVRKSLLWMVCIAYFSVPITAILSALSEKSFGIISGYFAIGMLAYFSGGLFPLLCQMGIRKQHNEHVGVAVSWIYFLNIVGATLGSLITGFVLFNILPLEWNVLVICAVILLMLALLPPLPSRRQCAQAITLLLLMCFLTPVFYDDIIGRLQGIPASNPPKYVNENHHGIITVFNDPDGDMIFGNGAYDGRFNIDPVRDSNGITRIYMLAALHPKPERILEMGMSAASATKVLTMYRPLQQLITVEINPGYEEIIAHYPQIASALTHPKMKLVIDDGRRWLNRHSDKKFDVITMNTIYFWRNNATHLLSYDFLELCKRHLNPGGVIYYNTTGARDSVFTIAHVFKHVVMYGNFVAASDVPFALTYAEKKKNLMEFIGDDGKPVFGKHPALLDKLVHEPLEDIRDSILSENNLWLITDDNMASEYRINHAFLPTGFYQRR